MANHALRDGNFVPSLIAVKSTDGITIDAVLANPVSHGLQTSDGTGGTDNGTPNAKHDQNFVHCLMAVSSVDGITPVAVYTDGSGRLLTQSS